jgi:hypothetical protein
MGKREAVDGGALILPQLHAESELHVFSDTMATPVGLGRQGILTVAYHGSAIIDTTSERF